MPAIKRDQILKNLREKMKQAGFSAVIILQSDPHQSEYIAEHWQARKWLTGFTGSAGTAVVTLDDAFLWTDFRYYIQAEKQTAGSSFQIQRIGEPEVKNFDEFLLNRLNPGDKIGIDGHVCSLTDFRKYEKLFREKGIALEAQIDFLEDMWQARPGLPASKAFAFSPDYAGRTRAEKLARIREKMKDAGASCHIMASLDDIAWTLNLRGKDIHTNPVNISFLLVFMNKAKLFMNPAKLEMPLKMELQEDKIETKAYEDVLNNLSRLDSSDTILLDPDHISYGLFQSISRNTRIIEKPNPAIALKTVKNEVEIGHLRDTAVKDGCAMVNFLYWLSRQDDDQKFSEIVLAQKLYQFRKEQPLFIDASFDTIMAWEDHSAMCHYSADEQSNARIGADGMLLLDSGGNYLTGTTDITRTLCFGNPSKQQIKDYTLVLKGHIAVASAQFPQGTKGYQIDTLARQALWENGMDFGHGTGHGVGFFLCVHEGPARLSPHPVDVKLEQGMVLTNEPGIYRENQYGIRLENMILVIRAFENEFGRFLKFENLTWCHFEKKLIDRSMLSEKEIRWINTYHETVYNRLSPVLKDDVKKWLKGRTSPI